MEKKPHQGPPPVMHAKPKASPPENTNAENFYYAKQIQLKTPMVVVLTGGEELTGVLEWYDRHCIRLSAGGGGYMVYKPAIRYMYKAEN